MSENSKFETIFESLQNILAKFAAELVCTKNESDSFYLNTNYIMKNKTPMFFGAVQIKKNYVTYHLMPIYVFPELLADISPELRRRMQGKSCFNFKSLDHALIIELAELTKAGYARFKQAGYVERCSTT